MLGWAFALLLAVALGLLVFFQADTHRLIPLYAIGVFLAFTLSQYGMVLRWRRRKGEKTFAGHYVNVLWAYFIVCVFSAGIQPNNGSRMYFIGMTALTMWALWTVRPQRYKFFAWAAAVGAVGPCGASISSAQGFRVASAECPRLPARRLP